MSNQNPSVPKRVLVYIDGFNLYFGLREAGFRRFYWLNVQALAASMVMTPEQLVKTKYFTARISGPPDKCKRQSDYLEALESLSGVQIFYGKYLAKPRRCPRCMQVFSSPEEKMTDVNIAVQMLSDAVHDSFDKAIVIVTGRVELGHRWARYNRPVDLASVYLICPSRCKPLPLSSSWLLCS